MADGRFAPSPTGPLHLGNLRTALLAWLFARAAGSRFLVRTEDLDPGPVREEHVTGQLEDLAALGLDWDGPVVRQSGRRDRYDAAIEHLAGAGLTYPCYCTRREVQEAARAPHGPAPDGAYPGTCRDLTPAARARLEGAGRRAALRLRAPAGPVAFADRLHGPLEGPVDDLVLRRADGVAAYNLAVVVDDADQGVQEVVRGDDLLWSTPRQVLLCGLLGLTAPAYAHVPLAMGPDGSRLAKRHGSVTLADLRADGRSPTEVVGLLAASAGLSDPGCPTTPAALLGGFDPGRIRREPWWPLGRPGTGGR